MSDYKWNIMLYKTPGKYTNNIVLWNTYYGRSEVLYIPIAYKYTELFILFIK